MSQINVGMGVEKSETASVFAQNTVFAKTESSTLSLPLGSVIQGTVSGAGKNASVQIGSRTVPVAQDIIGERAIGDTISFRVDSADDQNVVLKAMQDYVGAAADDVLGSVTQVRVERNTETFVGILSESDLRIDVVGDVQEDADAVSRLSAEDLQMLRRMGIDVVNSDLSHLMGLVNQYHAQQEGRTFQTGSAEVTQAIARAQEVGQLSDGAIKYMIDNQLSFTYENAYRAEFSASGQPMQQPLAEDAWEELKPQVDARLESEGWKPEPELVQAAKWLITQQCDVSRENLTLFLQIQDYNENGLDEQAYAANIQAQARVGESAKKAPLSGIGTALQAQRLTEQLQQVGYAACERAVQQSGDNPQDVERQQNTVRQQESLVPDITLRRLLTIQQSIEIEQSERAVQSPQAAPGEQTVPSEQMVPSAQTTPSANADDTAQNTFCQLQEIRLRLTMRTSWQLLQKGLPVVEENLQDMLRELNRLEERQTTALFRDSRLAYTDVRASEYQETMTVAQLLPQLPASALGSALGAQETITLRGMYRQGMAALAVYSRTGTASGQVSYETMGGAVATYETMMTTPRKDMGDRIQDAFARMDSLLRELGIEPTAQNQKAARILAYNSMELSPENIQRIAELDDQLQSVVQALQPEVVLGLIRDGVHPLQLPLAQLQQRIEAWKDENGGGREESYSRFLHRMDAEKSVTKEERDSYIGIYRLLHAVTANSDRDLGAVVKNGQELSLSNLLTAHRSLRQQGTETAIDDAFGMLDEVRAAGTSITEQISAAYSKMREEISQQMEVSQASQTAAKEAAEEVAELEQETLKSLQETNRQGIQLLERLQLSYTPANLEVAQELVRHPEGFYQEIQSALLRRGNEDTDAFDELEQKIVDRMQEWDARQDASATSGEENTSTPLYTDAFDDAFHITDEQQRFTGRDVMAARQIRTRMRVAETLGEHGHYLIPVAVGDEVLTVSIHFAERNAGESGFTAQVDTPQYGVIQAQLQMRSDATVLQFDCASKEGAQAIAEKQDAFVLALAQQGIVLGSVRVTEAVPTLREVFAQFGMRNGSDGVLDEEMQEEMQSERMQSEAVQGGAVQDGTVQGGADAQEVRNGRRPQSRALYASARAFVALLRTL